MENLQEKVEAGAKAAKSIHAYTWSWTFIILVAYSYFLYKAGSWAAEKQIEDLKKDKIDCFEDVEKERQRSNDLYNSLLIKNGVIDAQKEVIKLADSAAIELKK